MRTTTETKKILLIKTKNKFQKKDLETKLKSIFLMADFNNM